jgi:hypothetical protein
VTRFIRKLRENNHPIVRIDAKHNGPQADKADTDEAGNLHRYIPISINCRVMLLENLWTEAGAVNGSLGTVRDIVWPAGTTDPRLTMPAAILVDFDKYEGPEFIMDSETGRKLVLVMPATRDWVRGNATCSRTQFPLTVAYAITIHKSQGISTDQAVLNISGRKDFALRLTYVAISRIRSLKGLLFETPFEVKRLKFQSSETVIMRNNDYVRRQAQEVGRTEADDDDFPHARDVPEELIVHGPPDRSDVRVPTSEIPSGMFEDLTSDMGALDIGMQEHDRSMPPPSYQIPTQDQIQFTCETCNIRRSVGRRVGRDPDLCLYCRNSVALVNRRQWCMAHGAETMEYMCVYEDGKHAEICATCQGLPNPQPPRATPQPPRATP